MRAALAVHHQQERGLGPACGLPYTREPARVEDDLSPCLSQVAGTLLSLDGSRLRNLFDHYGLLYGRRARESARRAYHQWRGGAQGAVTGEMPAAWLDLLPSQLTLDEKFALIRGLRHRSLELLPQTSLRVIVSHRRELMTTVQKVVKVVRCARRRDIFAQARPLQKWLSRDDMQAVHEMLRQEEQRIVAQQIADLMMQSAMVLRVRPLAAPGVEIRVETRFEIHSASVTLRFARSFWGDVGGSGLQDDEALFRRLQDWALTPDRGRDDVEAVLRTLSLSEQGRLRALALAEGLQTEALLREIRAKTLAARGDIEATIAVAARLNAQSCGSRMTSDHATALGILKIEIRSGSRRWWRGRLS